MNPERPNLTQKLSERFDRGEKNSSDTEENRMLKSYQWIQDRLSRVPVPDLELDYLANCMECEYQKLSRVDMTGRRRFRPAYAMALLLLVLCGSMIFYVSYPAPSPVSRWEFQSDFQPSWLWKQKLTRGFTVMTPHNTKILFHLTEGSRIECSPNTRIQLLFHDERTVNLYAGEVLIHAASIPGTTMTVQTPLLQVNVIGTVFRVKVNP